MVFALGIPAGGNEASEAPNLTSHDSFTGLWLGRHEWTRMFVEALNR